MYVAFLVNRRKEKGISQYEMSRRLGMSRRQYQRIEDGSSGMSVELLEKLCLELDLKVLLVDKSILV